MMIEWKALFIATLVSTFSGSLAFSGITKTPHREALEAIYKDARNNSPSFLALLPPDLDGMVLDYLEEIYGPKVITTKVGTEYTLYPMYRDPMKGFIPALRDPAGHFWLISSQPGNYDWYQANKECQARHAELPTNGDFWQFSDIEFNEVDLLNYPPLLAFLNELESANYWTSTLRLQYSGGRTYSTWQGSKNHSIPSKDLGLINLYEDPIKQVRTGNFDYGIIRQNSPAHAHWNPSQENLGMSFICVVKPEDSESAED